jgi:predicted alpha/beta hydrolase
MSEPLRIAAVDGYALGGFVWRRRPTGPSCHPVVIVNSATSVRCHYYARFAAYLFDRGCDVVTYDYRGIGESRRGPLRGLAAGWLDWGQLDFEGVLRHVAKHFPGQPIMVVGHSIGGFAIGLAPSADRIERIFTMGAQFAYWRDYAPSVRRTMVMRWHLVMPLLVLLFGYLPAKRLGWMEDTPRRVALDWARMGPRFETSLGIRSASLPDRFARVRAPTLALGIGDDPFGTVAAIDRLLGYYAGCERHHVRLAPAAIDEDAIGHFAFFHQRFQQSLWPIAAEWLLEHRLPAPRRGTSIHSVAADPAAASHPFQERRHP